MCWNSNFNTYVQWFPTQSQHIHVRSYRVWDTSRRTVSCRTLPRVALIIGISKEACCVEGVPECF